MSELSLVPIRLKSGEAVNEFYFLGLPGTYDEGNTRYVFSEDFDKNNFSKIQQIVGISYKLKVVDDSAGKIKSQFLEKRRKLMLKVFGELAIFILKTMNKIIWLVEPKVTLMPVRSFAGAVPSEIGLERALVYALDIAENMFPLYKEIINIHYPSGVSQDITKLERDEFIADKRKEFGIVKSKKDK